MATPRTVYMPPRRQRHRRPPTSITSFLVGAVVGASFTLGVCAISYSCHHQPHPSNEVGTSNEVDCANTPDPFLCEVERDALLPVPQPNQGWTLVEAGAIAI